MTVGKGAAAKAPEARHPAQKYYAITLVLLLIMVLFGFISVFVPWAQKDLAVGSRAWAYPFKTCIHDTFSKVNAHTCLDNDFIVGPLGAPLTGGSDTCKAFVLTTIAFVFISVIGGVVCLLALMFITLMVWKRPVKIAALTQVFLIILCIAAFLAWIFFIAYAEKTCVPNSIFPVHGYSYGFILYIFGSTSSLFAVITGFMGFSKLRAFQPLKDLSDEEAVMVQEGDQVYPTYPLYEEGSGAQIPGPTPMSNTMSSFNAAPAAQYPSAQRQQYY